MNALHITTQHYLLSSLYDKMFALFGIPCQDTHC
jgi:hypothetical protein